MKKSLWIFITTLLFSVGLNAQTTVGITINHKLGSNDFALESAAQNNLGNDFEVTRLQYYLSRITLIYDGGQEKVFDDLFVLVNANEPTEIDLGENEITTVEMLELHVGVGNHDNHLDPAGYPSDHPLAPQNPSMHWGWNPGYRFVAFEGFGGSNFNQLFELHGLGDDNYFTTEIPFNATAENNAINLSVNADYTRALENLNVNGGLIVHGDFGEAVQCLENFRDYVFTSADGTTSSVDFSEVNKFEVFPNPSEGQVGVNLESSLNLTYQVSVTDLTGKQILFFDSVLGNSGLNLELKEAGFYFVNLIKEGEAVISRKLIIQ